MAGYIIDRRLQFKPGKQRELVLNIKQHYSLKWEDLSKVAGVSTHTISVDWAQERSTLPYHHLEKILNEYPLYTLNYVLFNLVAKELQPKWGQIKGGKASIAKASKNLPIVFPKKSDPKFSEFIGILLGDGHLSVSGIEIILEYPAENSYKDYIANLMSELFSRNPIIKIKKSNSNTIHLRINSKNLVKFLNTLGLKTGNKVVNGASIPNFINEDRSLLKCCIRGLIDTDGGIFNKQAGYSRGLIEFSNHSKPLLNSVKNGLLTLGFTPSKAGEGAIRIQTQKEIHKYAE
ncbi:MAG: LAGLIDADG family homing endonuclease, partial [Nitrosotalea sp.]